MQIFLAPQGNEGFTMANWKDGYANGWAYWNK